MLKYVMAFIVGVSFNIHAVSAPSKPSPDTVKRIINGSFGQSLMFFKPYELPIELERTHKPMVKKLDAWVGLGLLSKTKTRFLSEKLMYGALREVSVGGFKYDLNQDSPWVSDKGFFYGKPTILEIFEISAPSYVNSEYFSEVYFSWFATNIPDWTGKIDLKDHKHRKIKRALESKNKPFEKRLYLVYRDNQWLVWDEEGKEPLF